MTQPTQFGPLGYRVSDRGVAFITIDVSDRPVNVLTTGFHRAVGDVAAHLAADDQAVGAVIHSGKDSFMAGGDLKRIVRYYDMQRSPAEAYEQSRTYTESLRKLETCGKPVAVAVNGTALGGGLELALACHYRVVIDDPKVLLGLPEVKLGLLPAGGGTQRLPRLIGLKAAAELILSGRAIHPQEALDLGIIDAVANAGELLQTAETWVLDFGVAQQPWDRKGFRIPGGSKLNDMSISRLFQLQTARIGAEYRHNYPAPIAILRCLFNGTTVNSIDTALKIETREFAALTRDPVARNMIRTLFINRGGQSREEIMSKQGAAEIRDRLQQAYIQQGRLLAATGVKPALIENAGWAAGMPAGPLSLSDEGEEPYAANQALEDVERVKQRLLCAQALAAAELFHAGPADAVTIDLVSTLCCGFPSYTGGPLSYIDTVGLKTFVERCETLDPDRAAGLEPPAWLQAMATAGKRFYPLNT